MTRSFPLPTLRLHRVLLVLLLGVPGIGAASDVTYQAVLDWAAANADAPIDGLAPGAYGVDRVADFAAYIPPGYLEEFNFPELRLELMPTSQYVAHPLYTAATAQYGEQASIGADGRLEGYVAGRPFTPEAILAAPPEQAGYMVAWNQVHRWQYYGYRNEAVVSFLKATAAGSGGTLMPGMEGGGTVDRHVSMFYHRVYLSQLAQLPDSGYKLEVDGSDTLFFKEYIEMLAPFDIAGLKMVVERPRDQTLGDQVNSYLPEERRVRRLSAKERADSWIGTNWTMDDFEGFSGLVMDNTWKYIGRKVMLHVASSAWPEPKFHGPMSTIPLDRWQLRPCFVVEAIPRWEGHPYGRRLMFIDEQTYSVVMTMVFDRSDSLAKVMTTVYEYSEDLVDPAPNLTTPRWRSSIVVNLDERNANVAQGSKPTEFVEVEPSLVRKLFSVSNLSSGR